MGGVVDCDQSCVGSFLCDPPGMIDSDEGIEHPMHHHQGLLDLVGDTGEVESLRLFPGLLV